MWKVYLVYFILKLQANESQNEDLLLLAIFIYLFPLPAKLLPPQAWKPSLHKLPYCFQAEEDSELKNPGTWLRHLSIPWVAYPSTHQVFPGVKTSAAYGWA